MSGSSEGGLLWIMSNIIYIATNIIAFGSLVAGFSIFLAADTQGERGAAGPDEMRYAIFIALQACGMLLMGILITVLGYAYAGLLRAQP